MAHSTSQENPDGVASRDICNEQLSRSVRISDNPVRNATHPLTTAHKQSGQSPSRSSHKDLNRNGSNIDYETTIVDPLLRRFLLSLNAKEVVGTRGWHTFALQPGAYAKASKSLPESDPEVWGYVENKLRHDLIDDKHLIVKMPETIHEFVTQMITDSIKEQLAAIKKTSDEPTRRLIQNIRSIGSRRIRFNGVNGYREPDQQFSIKYSYYPGIIIEMAYSQSFGSLRQTENKKPYKISAWRPDFTRFENEDTVAMKAIVEQDIIRDKNGEIKSGSMTFPLQDFGRNLATTYPDADLTKMIAFDYNDLAGYLAEAENWQNAQPSP